MLMHTISENLAIMVLETVCSAIETVSRYDRIIQDEIRYLPEGSSIGFSVRQGKKPAAVRIKEGRIYRIKGIKSSFSPDLLITFKSLKAAWQVMTGQESVKGSYLKSRIYFEGDLMQAARLVRMMDRVVSYLFPDFILKKIIDPVPKRMVNRLKILCSLLITIPMGGLKHENT